MMTRVKLKSLFSDKPILMPSFEKSLKVEKRIQFLKSIERNSFRDKFHLEKFGTEYIVKKGGKRIFLINCIVSAIIHTFYKKRKLSENEQTIFKMFVKDDERYKIVFSEENNGFYKDYVVDKISETSHFELNKTKTIIKEVFDFYVSHFENQEDTYLLLILNKLLNFGCNLSVK